MKFTNGVWQLRDGVKLHNPQKITDYRIQENLLTAFVPCGWIGGAGDTLNCPIVTVEVSSPMENVIYIKAYRHKGGLHKMPRFPLTSGNPPVVIEDREEGIFFTSGETTAVLAKEGAFTIHYTYQGKSLTSSGPYGLAHVDVDGTCYMKEELSLDIGELVYGLGERFTPFVKNGQSVDIWNVDGGTGTERAYKNIPFYLTSKGYGVFVNHPEQVSYEIASEKVSRVQFSVQGEVLEYALIGAAEPKKALETYTSLTGKPALPPAWSFGLWLTTSFVTDYNEETVMQFIHGMEERNIPLEVFHFDCCWMNNFEWCNFQWNEKAFPQPERMLASIHQKGIKICVWINPYIGQKSPLFDEGMASGYFLRREDGSVWQWDMWQAGMALVDFTNSEAVRWYQQKLETLLDMGVDCFKTDFGERIPTDVVYSDGSDPIKMHNYYTQLYNKAVFDLLERKRGKGEAVLFARSATAGGQQYPVHWGGDCTSDFASMAESLRGGLSFALSGFGYWSHDIGGFEDGCQPVLYQRWTQFGLLSSHSRYHGSGAYKVPWLYGEQSVEVARFYTQWKLNLMPYLFRCAVETAQSGVPMMRAMVLEYPEDETCRYLDRQYFLGDRLLVAPVFSEDGWVSYYLPRGRWYHLLTGEEHQGEKWYREQYDYLHFPLFVKENTVLVTSEGHRFAEYDYTDQVVLRLFGFVSDCEYTVPVYDTKGQFAAAVTAVCREGRLQVDASQLNRVVRVEWNGQDVPLNSILCTGTGRGEAQ